MLQNDPYHHPKRILVLEKNALKRWTLNSRKFPYVAYMIVSMSLLLTMTLWKNKQSFLVLVALLDRHARPQGDTSVQWPIRLILQLPIVNRLSAIFPQDNSQTNISPVHNSRHNISPALSSILPQNTVQSHSELWPPVVKRAKRQYHACSMPIKQQESTQRHIRIRSIKLSFTLSLSKRTFFPTTMKNCFDSSCCTTIIWGKGGNFCASQVY